MYITPAISSDVILRKQRKKAFGKNIIRFSQPGTKPGLPSSSRGRFFNNSFRLFNDFRLGFWLGSWLWFRLRSGLGFRLRFRFSNRFLNLDGFLSRNSRKLRFRSSRCLNRFGFFDRTVECDNRTYTHDNWYKYSKNDQKFHTI